MYGNNGQENDASLFLFIFEKLLHEGKMSPKYNNKFHWFLLSLPFYWQVSFLLRNNCAIFHFSFFLYKIFLRKNNNNFVLKMRRLNRKTECKFCRWCPRPGVWILFLHLSSLYIFSLFKTCLYVFCSRFVDNVESCLCFMSLCLNLGYCKWRLSENLSFWTS